MEIVNYSDNYRLARIRYKDGSERIQLQREVRRYDDQTHENSTVWEPVDVVTIDEDGDKIENTHG